MLFIFISERISQEHFIVKNDRGGWRWPEGGAGGWKFLRKLKVRLHFRVWVGAQREESRASTRPGAPTCIAELLTHTTGLPIPPSRAVRLKHELISKELNVKMSQRRRRRARLSCP